MPKSQTRAMLCMRLNARLNAFAAARSNIVEVLVLAVDGVGLDRPLEGYFVSAYEEEPNNIEVLNYLGLVYYMVGDIIMSEIYYQEALLINPNNNLINQKLGELYFNTERVNLAQEKLKKLSKCNCEEYSILKKIISGK